MRRPAIPAAPAPPTDSTDPFALDGLAHPGRPEPLDGIERSLPAGWTVPAFAGRGFRRARRPGTAGRPWSRLGRFWIALGMVLSGQPADSRAEAVALPPGPPRPGAESGPTEVHFTAWFLDVSRIESAAQSFEASLMLVLRWSDPSLAHPGPDAKRFSIGDIWHPALLVVNEEEEVSQSLPEVAEVSPDGTVVWRQRLVGAFTETLNLHDFPFDRDQFRITFAVPGRRPEEIRFVPDDRAVPLGMTNGVGRSETLTIQDWSLLSLSSETHPHRIAPGLDLAAFSVSFLAKRETSHFLIKVILPLILIVAMSWAVFWIEPHDAGTQVGVAITAMLTLIAYRFAIDSDVPKLPYLTRLDAFVLMSSILVFLSLIEVLLTTKFANRDRMDLARAVDRKCRWVFPITFALGTWLTLAAFS